MNRYWCFKNVLGIILLFVLVSGCMEREIKNPVCFNTRPESENNICINVKTDKDIHLRRIDKKQNNYTSIRNDITEEFYLTDKKADLTYTCQLSELKGTKEENFNKMYGPLSAEYAGALVLNTDQRINGDRLMRTTDYVVNMNILVRKCTEVNEEINTKTEISIIKISKQIPDNKSMVEYFSKLETPEIFYELRK